MPINVVVAKGLTSILALDSANSPLPRAKRKALAICIRRVLGGMLWITTGGDVKKAPKLLGPALTKDTSGSIVVDEDYTADIAEGGEPDFWDYFADNEDAMLEARKFSRHSHTSCYLPPACLSLRPNIWV